MKRDNYKLFLKNISLNDDQIEFEEYDKIMKLVLTDKEYIVVRQVIGHPIENEKKYTAPHIVYGKAVAKLGEIYKINNSFNTNIKEIHDFCHEKYNQIFSIISVVKSIKDDNSLVIEIPICNQNPITKKVTIRNKRWVLEDLEELKNHYQNVIDNLKTPKEKKLV